MATTGATRRVRGLARRLRTVPRAVWALQALFVLLLVLWSQLTPIGRAPDEHGHAALAYWLADGEPYPDYDDFHPYSGIFEAALAHMPGNPVNHSAPMTPDSATPRSERPTLEGWGGREPWPFANQLAQHPPLYYRVAAAGLWAGQQLAPPDQPLEREWMLLRLVSIAMVAPLPLLAWATARTVGVGPTGAITAAGVPLAVPQLAHVSSAVQNDALIILSSGLFALIAARVLSGDRRWTTAMALGAVTGIALWTKAMAFAFVVAIPVLFAVSVIGERDRRRPNIIGASVATGTALLVGSWWWIRNLVEHGALQPSILDNGQPPSDFEPRFTSYVADYVPTIVHRFWGNFGGYEAPLRPVLVALATAAFAAAVLFAFRRPAASDVEGTPRLRLAALASPAAVLGLGAFASAYRHYVATGIAGQIQGRYLFGGMVVCAPVVGLGLVRILGRRAPLALLGLAAVLHLDGARAALDAFWGEPDASLRRSASSLAAWSPLPPPLLVGLVVAAVVAVTAAAVALRPGRLAPGEPEA